MTRENKMVELLQQENTSEVGKEDENLILLLLSSDLRDRYMKTLVGRLIKIGVVVAIEEIDYPLVCLNCDENMYNFEAVE